MVKKVDLQTFIPSCTAQRFYEKVYSDAEPMHKYHQLVNHDEAAEVTAWENGVRTVSFCMPLNAPDFVKKISGVEVVKVAERQTVVWHSALHFTVSSETTVLNIPGANKFTTSLFLSVLEDGQQQTAVAVAAAAAAAAAVPGDSHLGPEETERLVAGATAAGVSAASGLTVRFSVKCSAGLPWPMNASIENIMSEKAQASMSEFLDFCCRLVDENLANTRGALHRWPTAIAASTLFDDMDLERPLLMSGEQPSPEGDAEVFYSPRNLSESSTPSRWDSRQQVSISDVHTMLERATSSHHGSIIRAANPTSTSEAWAAAMSARPMKESAQVADLLQVVVVLQQLQQTVQRLDEHVTMMHRSQASNKSKWSNCHVLLVIAVTVAATVGVLYLHFWHQTGLLPQPPALAQVLHMLGGAMFDSLS